MLSANSIMSASLPIFILSGGSRITYHVHSQLDAWQEQELGEKSEVGQFANLLCGVVKIIHQLGFMLTGNYFSRAK